MSNFRVGQRVGVIGDEKHGDFVGTVLGERCDYWYLCSLDGHAESACGWRVHHLRMVPLTDPGADAFLARIKSLKPYSEPFVSLSKADLARVCGGAA